jgi:hypothetical protein
MARTDRFMVAPIEVGTQTNLKPWLIADDAFQTLENAYLFRGRIRKRFGSYLMNQVVGDNVAQLYSRLRINIGTTAAVTGNFSGFVPLDATSGLPIATPSVGQLFSVGSTIFTVNALGLPAVLLTTGAATATYNTTTGAIVITGNNENPSTDVYYFPANSVVGLVNYESGLINDEPTFAFDQNFAYEFINNAWERLSGENEVGAAQWDGQDYQLMWGYTFRGAFNFDYFLFVTNFNTADYMRYYDGTDWNFFSPVLNGIERLLTARIILPFKDRLLCLNTVENSEGSQQTTSNIATGNFTFAINPYVFTWGQTIICGTTTYTIVDAGGGLFTVDILQNSSLVITATFVVALGIGTFTSAGDTSNLNTPVFYVPNNQNNPEEYVNRCRFSQNSQIGSPVAANSYLTSVSGLGGRLDAPVKEAIVTAGFIKDRLIVYFESSTWELAYTGNQIAPFVWQRFNTELGAESTFSVVPFDKALLGIGTVGIHACNGSNVDRIDQLIPDSVFQISNANNGIYRVYGIRDYWTELVYWTIPSADVDGYFPNTVLVYNYRTGSWAFNDDTITAFGYYQNQQSESWASIQRTWQESVQDWSSPTMQTKFRQIVAGNQQGFVFIVDNENTRNSISMQITNITFAANIVTITSINHNLLEVVDLNSPTQGNYVAIENVLGIAGLDSIIYPVHEIIDGNTFTIVQSGVSGTYLGGGTLALVSNINIVTKQYNFYVQQGLNASINKVDFLVDSTDSGQVVVDYAVSSSTERLLEQSALTGAITGNGVLDTSPYVSMPSEQFQERLWHSIYPLTNGECIQLNIYMNNDQMINSDISWSSFQMHGMTFYAQPSGRLQ